MGVLVPARRRGLEVLDDPRTPATLRERSLDDVARANALLGGRRAVLAALEEALDDVRGGLAGEATLLDVGPGVGDIPASAREIALRRGVILDTLGVDEAAALAAVCRTREVHAACGDARALPARRASVDFVTCSQMLHHFPDAEARDVIRELDRVGRRRVIVSDIRRSWVAALGIWVVSFPLGFHPVSRHDGVVSVLRGFTAGELRRLVRSAIGVDPVVRTRAAFRVTASWVPSHCRQ